MGNVRKPLLETHPHLKGFMEFLEEFNKETERGASLAAAAMIDDQLGRTIEAFLVPNKGSKALLDGFNAPLGSFSATHRGSLWFGTLSEAEYRGVRDHSQSTKRVRDQSSVLQDRQSCEPMCSVAAIGKRLWWMSMLIPRGQFTTAPATALILPFDEPSSLCRETAVVCNCPVALLSLVATRQHLIFVRPHSLQESSAIKLPPDSAFLCRSRRCRSDTPVRNSLLQFL